MATTSPIVDLETVEAAPVTSETQEVSHATQNTAPRKCYRRVHSCVRCGNPIEVGQVMEPWLDGPRSGTRYNWVHAGCGKSAPVPVQPIPKDPVKLDEFTHEAFVEVLELAKAGMNVLLPGPAGCGKTHLSAQVAKALGRQFGMISCSAGMSEGQITGRLLPVGDGGRFEYVTTSFVDCYERGGVFLLDEMDAADPNVLLVINSAISNGELSLPNRTAHPVAKRHPDFVLIAAANTYGRGADRMYVGRNQLDEATLDRFRIGTVPMDYDKRVEAKLCPDSELRKLLQDIRSSIHHHRLLRIVSSRFIQFAYRMKTTAGWSNDKILEKLFASWSEDEVRKVR